MKFQKIINTISLFGATIAVLGIVVYISYNSLFFPEMIVKAFKEIPADKANITKITQEYNDNIAEKNIFLELYALVANHMDQRIVNDRVKLNNGMLLDLIMNKNMINKQVACDNIESFNQKISVPFLFIQLPNKLSNSSNLLPIGVLDDSQQYTDEFLLKLDDRNVDYYDLRKLYNDDNRAEMFFITDHHWTSRGAFAAFCKIANVLENNGIEIPEYVTRIDNYNSEIYEDIFLGSSGKRTGIRYTELDDFELLYPKFDTSFDIKRITMNDDAYDESGNYKQALINEDYITYNYYNYNVYNAYLGSSYKQVIIKNNNDDCADKRILLIRDSYAKPVICFLAGAVKCVDALDLRYVEDDFSLVDYVTSSKPDMVLMMYSPFMYENESCFQHLY